MNFKRRLFGKGTEVSLFTLGTMRAITSAEHMHEIIEAAYFAGINHIETAPTYGPAEDFLGQSIQQLKQNNIQPEGGWVITSKILPNLQFSEGKRLLRRMLGRLKIEKLNNLAIHGLNLEEHLEWVLEGDGSKLINWAKDQNLVNQIGFSSHGSTSLIKKAINTKIFNFCSLHLHLLDPERIPLAKIALEEGMGVMAISPADKGGHLNNPSKALVEDCHPIPPIELAYRFLLAQGITTLTVGASKKNDFIIPRKLGFSDGPLNEVEKSSIKQLNKKRKQRLGETYCGQCRACLPCPSQIPINEILRLRNLNIGHELYEYTKERYNLINRAGHWWETVNASSCNNCGDCLPRCPYHLKIPDLLKDAHLRLVDKPSRRLWE